MAEQLRDGFRYAVGDAQLAAYARMTLRQRLEWVDAARILTLKLRTPETAIRQALASGTEHRRPRSTGLRGVAAAPPAPTPLTRLLPANE